MQHECKITVLETKCFPDLQERYLGNPKSGPCPLFKPGDTFLLKRIPQQDDFYHLMNGGNRNTPEISMGRSRCFGGTRYALGPPRRFSYLMCSAVIRTSPAEIRTTGGFLFCTSATAFS